MTRGKLSLHLADAIRHLSSSFLLPPPQCLRMEENRKQPVEPLPLSSVNHISRNCANIQDSLNFYVNILGFNPVKRPGSLGVKGAWLYNYGIGIHLLQRANGSDHSSNQEEDVINPEDDHISFHQCEDTGLVQQKLKEAGIKFEKRVVAERGIEVEQIFFHDPDGFMIEICTCEKLPVELLPLQIE